ncbi:MAG: hypothetical protein ACLQJ0_20775 [Steroidobacteraceae bacterium]
MNRSADSNPRFTVAQLHHELSKNIALISSLRLGLDFLARGTDRRILYVVDYPEITSHWQSARPNDASQLSKDGVQRVWEYLTSLEQIFLNLDSDVEHRLSYVQRAYDDQAEYTDGLLLANSFNTMIAPPTWNLLRDDIIYVSHFGSEAAGNWTAAINNNLLQLRTLIGSTGKPPRFSESVYIADAQKFGFASLARNPASDTQSLLLPFISHANFRDPVDMLWEDPKYGIRNPSRLRDALEKFNPADRAKNWLEWIKRGNNLYNQAYNRHGQWARQAEGSETLAYIEFLNQTIGQANPNLIIAFITRNRQYFDSLLAMHFERNEEAPLLFHPRLLSAFMIKQTDLHPDERAEHAERARKTLDELRNMIRMVDGFVEGVAARTEDELSKPLAHFVSRRLLRGWMDYRQQSFAEQVQLRIESRKTRWEKRPASDRIRKYLEQIVDNKLKTVQIGRELALLSAFPDLQALSAGIGCTCIRLPEKDDNGVVLFHSDQFTHVFKFHSATIVQGLRSAARFPQVDIFSIVTTAIAEIQKRYGEFLAAGQKHVSRSEAELSLLRFDVFLIFALLHIARGRFALARQLIESARTVWRGDDDFPTKAIRRQLYEALYVDGLIRRLEWRGDREGDKSSVQLRKGIEAATRLIREGKELKTDDVPQIKRLRMLEVAFTRELYGFAARHNLKMRDLGGLYSIGDCVQVLDEAYVGAIESGNKYLAMRARQQYLAFARMANEGILGEVEKEKFSFEEQLKAFKEFENLLSSLRQEAIIDPTSIPFSVLITELAGLWKFRDVLPADRHVIRARRAEIRRLFKQAENKSFGTWANLLLDEIENGLKSG